MRPELLAAVQAVQKAAKEPNATTDHDADLRDPEPCSCEEAEALRERLVAVEKVWAQVNARATTTVSPSDWDDIGEALGDP